MATSPRNIEIITDPAALADRAAAWLLERVMAAERTATICLSGGETPRLVYEALVRNHLTRFPWDRVHWFWGDERFVPRSDPRSNFRMVKEALFDRAPVPAENIHPVLTEGVSIEESAAAYERELKLLYAGEELRPERLLFDVSLLGLGPDGHTASLLPGAPVLEERRKWVAPVIGFADEPRVTLTYPVLESSRHSAFVVAGGETRNVVADIWRGTSSAPAARLQPKGALQWFLDRAAAPGPNPP